MMDWILFLTIIGTGITVIGFIYTFLRNFKIDIKSEFTRINTTIEKIEIKIEKIEKNIGEIKERLASLEALEKIASEERIARKVIALIHEENENKKKVKGE